MTEFDEKGFRARNVSAPFYDSTHSIVGRLWHEDKDLQQRMRDTIKGKRIIEIGCCDLLRYCLDLFAMGAKSYVGVDPYHVPDAEGVKQWFAEMGFDKMKDKDIQYVRRDALSYLESIPSGDGIVTFSSGTLEGSIIHNTDYGRQVVHQIVRLAKAEPSAIHVTDEFFTDLMKEEGLHLDFGKEIPSNGFVLGIYSRAQPQ